MVSDKPLIVDIKTIRGVFFSLQENTLPAHVFEVEWFCFEFVDEGKQETILERCTWFDIVACFSSESVLTQKGSGLSENHPCEEVC